MIPSHHDVDKRPVVLIGLAVGLSLLGDVSIYAILPVYHEVLGFGPIEVGILLSANRWVRLVTNHLARRLSERFRPRDLFAIALFFGSVITLVYATAPPFWIFLIARMAWGLCWSFIRHTGVMTSISVGTTENATGVLGVYNGTVQFGYIAGTLAGAALFDVFGFSYAFVTMAIISVAAVAFDYAGFRLIPAQKQVPRRSEPIGPARDLPMLIRSFITTCVGVGLLISTLGFALQERFGDSIEIGAIVIGIATVNGILIALHYGINSVGSPFLGAGIDRIGRRAAEIASFTVGSAALIGAAVFTRSPVLVPVIVVFFVANVASRLSLMSRAGLAGSASFSRLISAADFGAATGPLIGWFAIERVGSPDVVFAIGAALYAIAAISAMLSRRENEGSVETAGPPTPR